MHRKNYGRPNPGIFLMKKKSSCFIQLAPGAIFLLAEKKSNF